MFTNTRQQLQLILWCFLLGMAAGIFYDFLREFRPKKGTHFLTDALYVTVFFLCLFMIGYTAGKGVQRLYAPVFVLVSAALYFCGLSAVFRFVFAKFALLLRKICSIVLYPFGFILKTAKKLCKFLKNSFYSSKFCYKIKCGRERAKEGKQRLIDSMKGTANETEKGRYYY